MGCEGGEGTGVLLSCVNNVFIMAASIVYNMSSNSDLTSHVGCEVWLNACRCFSALPAAMGSGVVVDFTISDQPHFILCWTWTYDVTGVALIRVGLLAFLEIFLAGRRWHGLGDLCSQNARWEEKGRSGGKWDSMAADV